MYILLQYSLTMLLIFAVMQVVVKVFGNRISADSDTQDEESESSNTFPLNSPDDKKKNSDFKYSDPEIDPLKVWKW